MRLRWFVIAIALVACGKKTAPTPAVMETNAPARVATLAPTVAPTSSAAIVDAADDVEDAAEEDAGVAPWVTAKSTGCFGWNPTTRHAICLSGMCGSTTSGGGSVIAVDLFDHSTQVEWFDSQGCSGSRHMSGSAAAVEKVGKLVAKLHLTPLDKKKARMIGIGEEVLVSAAKKLKIRYKRSTTGGETSDKLELVCKTSTWLAPSGGKWSTQQAPTESTAELYVDAGETMAVVVWSTLTFRGQSDWAHDDFAAGIDLTMQEDCF